ncbi:MAG: hypothetical protein LBD93_00170 [Treponema sp.]|jgi:hypothetical protein|nr:hypothetical protein [Treponema sp.]
MQTITPPEKKPIILMLVKRTMLFFFGICLLSLFLYGIGTNQGFKEQTQFMLLHITVMVGLFIGVGSMYGIGLDLWLMFHKKYRYLRGIGGYLCLGVFGIIIAALASFVLVLTEGNL